MTRQPQSRQENEALAEEKYYNYRPPPESGIKATLTEAAEAAESATAAPIRGQGSVPRCGG